MKDDDTEFTEDELRSMARVERRCGEYQIGAGQFGRRQDR